MQMRTYELMATPLIYPGQRMSARIAAEPGNIGDVQVALRLKAYTTEDALRSIDGDRVRLRPGEEQALAWVLPDLGGQPVAEIGLTVAAADRRADGVVLVDHVRWDSAPDLHLRRPAEPSDFWRRSWVNGVSAFSTRFPPSFRISQDHGEGLIIHGTRQWTDYKAAADLTVHLGNEAGLAVRVQGLRRYYAAVLSRDGMLRIVRQRDEARTVLAETAMAWSFETTYDISVEVVGTRIRCRIGETSLAAEDDSPQALGDGGIGLLVHEGALSSNDVRVTGVRSIRPGWITAGPSPAVSLPQSKAVSYKMKSLAWIEVRWSSWIEKSVAPSPFVSP
jgi:hypothetical protein